AAEDYVEKLPVLFSEFAEAARHEHDNSTLVSTFCSATDLMQKTPGFWENYVQQKLGQEFGGLYRFLNNPYPSGRNQYVDRVEANMERLRRELARGRQASA